MWGFGMRKDFGMRELMLKRDRNGGEVGSIGRKYCMFGGII